MSDEDRDDDLLPPEDEVDAPDAEPVGSDRDGKAPLEDLAERAREGRERAPDEDAVMDAFDEVEAEQLWSELESRELTDVVDEPVSDAERDVQVVAKQEYCMRCQHFSAPPEVRCTHPDGEITEMVDTEHFRVADCPILRGEEELENLRGK